MIKSIACFTDEELVQALLGSKQSLRELAPYNGTAPGARAIAEERKYLEHLERELERRESIWVLPYSNGDRQVVLRGRFPKLGSVDVYSDGKAETTVDLFPKLP